MKSLLSLTVPYFALSAFTQQALAERQLSAATLHSSIQSRSNDVRFRRKFNLHYVEDSPHMSSSATAARLEVESSIDTLLLEDIEHLAEFIGCSSDAALSVRFHPDYFQQARKTFEANPNIMIITSHAGCNTQGTRMPYKTSGCTVNEHDSEVKFMLSEASWKKDFKMKMGFSPASASAYGVRRHGHPVKRGIFDIGSASPSLSTATVSSTSIIASESEVSFPSATATSELPQHSAVGNVAASLVNTQILPPTVDNVTLGIPLKNIPVTVSCIECSTAGQITLSSGSFSVDGSNDTEHFLSDGFLEVQANNLTAHVALDLKWDPAQTEAITINLPQIPLDPFAIPGVANVGVTFQPVISLAAAISEAFEFQYGFDVVVPNNSTALASLGSAENSTVTGFENTQIHALPLNSTFGNITMTFSATLQPQLLLGVALLDQKAGAAVFLNMPQVSLAIEQVSGTNGKCESGATISAANTTEIQSVNKLLGNLTHIVPEVELAAGFVIQAGSLGQTAYTPLATTFTLDTSCYAFKTAESSYLPATAAFASATSSQAAASAASASAAAATSKSAASATKMGAMEGNIWGGFEKWQTAAVALCVIFGGFAQL